MLNGIGKAVDQAVKTRPGQFDFAREIAGQINRWHEEEVNAVEIIPKRAAGTIGPGKTVLTLSSSELVKQTFFALKNRGVKAIVLESRPLREGERTALDLAKAGIPTTLVIDGAFPSLEKEVDAILIGADRIGKTLVNKVGTRTLLEWAKSRKKPVFVVCQISKFAPPSWRLQPLPKAPSGEVSRRRHPKLDVRNFYFEEVPLSLPFFFVTEKGRLDPKKASARAASVRTSRWFAMLLKRLFRESPRGDERPNGRKSLTSESHLS